MNQATGVASIGLTDDAPPQHHPRSASQQASTILSHSLPPQPPSPSHMPSPRTSITSLRSASASSLHPHSISKSFTRPAASPLSNTSPQRSRDSSAAHSSPAARSTSGGGSSGGSGGSPWVERQAAMRLRSAGRRTTCVGGAGAGRAAWRSSTVACGEGGTRGWRCESPSAPSCSHPLDLQRQCTHVCTPACLAL